MPTPPPRRPRIALRCVTVVAVVLLALAGATWVASAQVPGPPAPAPPPTTLDGVIDNVRRLLVGLLIGLATLFLTVGAVRYLAADGDPGEVERAKKSMRGAIVGYALAALAPLIVSVLRSVVG